jgi:membrane protease YdiL (CAAX protease family)
MAVSSIAAAYLEEAFFRVFLLRRLLAYGTGGGVASLVSAALFAACHSWEGLAGVAGAFLSGLFLNYWIEREQSLASAALPHAAYNIAVYLLPF